MGNQPAFMDLNYERVVYAKNPLSEVSFKIDFAPLFEIETEVPADFHKKIREDYPLFEIEENHSISLGTMSEQSEPVISSRSYLFLTADRHKIVKLSKNSFELTTDNYKCWEDFSLEIKKILSSLFEVYQLQYLQKVDLKYQDIIDPTRLGLKDCKWGDLFVSSVAGWLTEEEISNSQASSFSSSVLYFIEDDKIHSQCQTLENAATSDKAFLLTTHFFVELQPQPTTQEQILSHAKRLHGYTGKFFRSCITDKLHERLCQQESTIKKGSRS